MSERYNYNWNVGHRGKNCNSTSPVKSVIDYSILLYSTPYSTLCHFTSIHFMLDYP